MQQCPTTPPQPLTQACSLESVAFFLLGKLNTLSGFHYSKKVFDTLAVYLVKKKKSIQSQDPQI